MGTVSGSILSAVAGAGIAGLVFWGWTAYSPAVAPQPTPPLPVNPVRVVDGLTIVTLDAGTQGLGGIGVSEVSGAKYEPQVTAYGTVLDLQPFIDLYGRYRTASADLMAARAAVSASNQEADRNRVLYQDGRSVSLKTAQSAEASALGDKAKLQSAEANEEALHASAVQQYGPRLAQLFISRTDELSRLLDRHDVLVRVAMPVGTDISAPKTIAIDDGKHHLAAGTLVSASPQSDPITQGTAYLYRATAMLPVGAKIIARLPTGKKQLPGVILPADAVVWYGGQPWAYVMKAPNSFVRYPVSDKIPVDGGFFVTSSFRSGDRVVTRGAQLLLSEEQRPPPSSVAACKDPECDG